MNKATHYALLIGLLSSATSVLAVDTLDVGQDGRLGRWDSIVEEAQFLGVARDSIWTWPAEAGENLSLRLAERGGMAVGLVANLDGTFRVPLGTLLYDGDTSTAFDPDQFDAINRSTPVEIDLGAVFRIDRVRLFPRLDRQNRRRFLQVFRLLTKAESQAEYDRAFSFFASTPNVEPVVEKRIDSRDVRYVLIEPSTEREWELAEVEIYGAGDAPVGTYVSRPVRARYPNIVWGKVRYEGGSIENAPATVQTRTGSDRDPEHYFRLDLQAEDGLLRVSREDYQALPDEEKGPIKPNPLWSSWQTVSGGLMRSPGLRRFLQFRVRMASPGAVLRRLVFEFARPPVVSSLLAEISPGVVQPGVETRFTLSMEVRLRPDRGRDPQATGFRFLQVRTDAQVTEIERILVDDEEISFSATYEPSAGFDIDLWRHIEQTGTFVQIVFRGTVFRDYTRFEVRALDRRDADGQLEEAYQVADERDVDPSLEGTNLVVRFADGNVPLVAQLQGTRLFTPNGDRINDAFALSYALLKLVAEAAVTLEMYDLAGRRVRRAYEGMGSNGSYAVEWDGTDDQGLLVPPGLYLYELRVQADEDSERRWGSVGVAY
ncbi:MAG: gliding motility-associated C-terminal domain-containing protein [Candidatus Latescibacteria bacterium]|nr:gliding motility-associated C-terminal domain-containing protein [Candidatus Latescibacterota bacterium]